MLAIFAWVLVVIDALLAIALTLVTGVLSSIFLSSHVTSDKRIGVGMMVVALALLAHPGMGIWWAWNGDYTWALVYASVGSLITGTLAWLAISSIEPAARP